MKPIQYKFSSPLSQMRSHFTKQDMMAPLPPNQDLIQSSQDLGHHRKQRFDDSGLRGEQLLTQSQMSHTQKQGLGGDSNASLRVTKTTKNKNVAHLENAYGYLRKVAPVL